MQLRSTVNPLSKALLITRPVARHLEPFVSLLEPEQAFLQTSFADTYWRLRALMAVIAFAFPIAIPVVGKLLYDVPFQNSLSAYYFATAPTGDESSMRVWFFGGLVVLGCCLFAYKGYSGREDKLLTLAGVCAIGVATFPMPWPSGSDGPISAHYIFAMLLFVLLAWVCVGCSRQTLREADEETRQTFEPLYYLTGAGMLTFPTTAYIWTLITHTQGAHVFWMELFGIWTFAAFWTLKNAELRATSKDQDSVELRALRGHLSPKPAEASGPSHPKNPGETS